MTLRTAALVLAVSATACNSDIPLGLPDPSDRFVEVETEQNLKDQVDILFVIDDSGSMAPKQEQLRQRFPDLVKSLDEIAAAGNKASYHIGVVTSDLGAPGISCGKNRGARLQQLGGEAPAGCQGPVGANYIEYDQRNGSNNLPVGQDLPTTFGCMASVGDKGCGFEQTLEAAYRALHDPIPENAGFLRPSAILVVVFLTDEDDCSVDPTSDLFTMNPAYGPLNSYRCAEFGLVCDGQLVPRTPQASFSSCRPARPDEGGKLADIRKYINFFTQPTSKGGVKASPNSVVLSSISGPPSPIGTVWQTDASICGAGVAGCTTMAHACVAPTDTSFFGDPAVRIAAVVNQARHRAQTSICETDYKASVEGLGQLVNAALQPACMTRPLTDLVEPNCVVEDETAWPDGRITRTPIPRCTASSTTTRPCWQLTAMPLCQPVCNPLDGQTQQIGVEIDRGGQQAPPNTTAHVTCEVVPSDQKGLACP
jgi:hypothetical protein